MSLLDTPVRAAAWVALDFESAGAAPGRTDEPVQVGLAVWRGGEVGDFFRSYIHAPVRVTRAARAVHGIGDEELTEAPPMMALWPEFKARLSGAVVVAHGAGTEKRFMRAFPLHGFGPWVDTLSLARAVLPDLPDHALGTVAAACGVEPEVRRLCPGLDWHDALFDAVASLVVLRHVVAVLELGEVPVGQLQSLDAAAYRQRRGVLRVARQAGWAGTTG
ncbi:MAG: exonuclease domain-containing protein [Chthoniobacterales bacterium]